MFAFHCAWYLGGICRPFIYLDSFRHTGLHLAITTAWTDLVYPHVPCMDGQIPSWMDPEM